MNYKPTNWITNLEEVHKFIEACKLPRLNYGKIENLIMQKARNINIYVEFETLDSVADVIEVIKSCDIRIFDVEINRAKGSEVPPSAVFSVRLPKHFPHVKLISTVASVEAVKLIEEV